MSARAEIALPPGATEAECLRASRRMPRAEDRQAFALIVRVWQYAAYGQRLPAEHEGTSSVELTPPPEITRKRALTGLPFRQV